MKSNIKKPWKKMPSQGFTVVEIVVVIAVIVLLAGITIPAIGSMREASRLNTCTNNLRQQTLGMLEAEQTSKIIPHQGGVIDLKDPGAGLVGSEITAIDGSRVRISMTYNSAGLPIPLRLGDPQSSAQEQVGPWCYAILPYIDENVAFQQIKFTRQQPLFICPTRGRYQMAAPIDDELFSCQSGGWAWAKSDYAVTSNVGWQMCGQPLAKFERYGTDKIVLLGEKAMDLFIQPRTSWLHDEPLFTTSVSNSMRSRTQASKIYRDGIDADIQWGFGSSHASGVNFGFFSGRIQTIDFDIDSQVWGELHPRIPFDESYRIELDN